MSNMDRVIENHQQPDINHPDHMRAPRPDAVLLEFRWRQGVRCNDRAAIDQAPRCIREAETAWGKPGIYAETDGYIQFVCDGAYGDSAVLRPDELPELLKWLDTYFAGWRAAPGPYSLHGYEIRDYTQAEVDRLLERERIWSTFEPHLARNDA